MRRLNIYLIPVLVMMLLVSGCGNQAGNEDPEGSASVSEEHEKGVLTISNAQFAAAGMKTGTPEQVTFRQVVKAPAYVAATPRGAVDISSLVTGRVSDIYISEGDKIKKGQKLFRLEGSEIIGLQQDYAASVNQLRVLEAAFERQKLLARENISAGKALLSAESEYRTMLARTTGLKARLQLLNLDPKDVQSGQVVAGIDLSSPIGGYVTGLDLRMGQVIQPGLIVAQVIDLYQMQLELAVFEKDLDMIQSGQQVRYYDPESPGKIMEAELISVGKTVEPDSRTIRCLARMKAPDQEKFVNHSFVQAEIVTCEREVTAVTREALITENDLHFLMVKTGEDEDGRQFEKRRVRTGVTQGDFVELLDDGLEEILLKGSYDIAGI